MKQPSLPRSGWQSHLEQTGPDAGRFWNIYTKLMSGLVVRTLRTDAAPTAVLAVFAASGRPLPKFLIGLMSPTGEVLSTVGLNTAEEAYAAHFIAVRAAVVDFQPGVFARA